MTATASTDRHPLRRRLAAWVAAGVAPADLAPAAVAAAHVRITGRPAARDPQHRATRVYSADELRAALLELGHRPQRSAPPPPPPPDLRPLVWAAALQRLPLPSTRMLLSQQAQLLELRESGRKLWALVAVVPRWRPLVESRRDLVTRALADTMARPVALQLLEVGQ